MSPSTSALPSVLRVAADELDPAGPDAPASGERYRALLSGPAGSGTVRAVILAGEAPHDLVVVQYSDAYARAWLRGDVCADGVAYSLLAELPASFPARAPAIAR
ncbi:hypothetical protein KNO15_06970 [Leifsonia shinshuensis]|uniref:hypothetical protein n=1 Tax=Leifsonia shinshuensis TaxID=150026 RepID=UPI001F5133C4|nr:hypothetical protein [Leifsonia shinshuensis]MCI0156434.1 hypothetical protein [Leifsonia shinshuensis]